MARAIHELLVNDEKRKRMADEARAEAQQRFSLDRMVEETERIYSEVLGLRERGQAAFPT
jgi:glycosyltransferase involved in cell wall biosynthesis